MAIRWLSIGLFIGLALGEIVWNGAHPLPVVEADTLTGECVAVHTVRGPGRCDQLPERYDRVAVAPVDWVKREENRP